MDWIGLTHFFSLSCFYASYIPFSVLLSVISYHFLKHINYYKNNMIQNIEEGFC